MRRDAPPRWMSRCSMRRPAPAVGSSASSVSMPGRLLRAVKLLPTNSMRTVGLCSFCCLATGTSILRGCGRGKQAARGGADFGWDVVAAGEEELERFLGGKSKVDALIDRDEVEPARD